MENDIRLLEQLLALGDSIQELKKKTQSEGMKNADLYPETKSCSYKSHSNDVTNVFLDDDSDDDERPNTDFYFSRKDSILRIPIAPRTSNRKLSIQKIARKASQLRSSRLLATLNGAEAPPMLTRNLPNSDIPSKSLSSSARASNGSIDSGIRDGESSSPTCSSPSPTFKDQKF
ncbi:unnamed protein product [Enterobius vermicularis]|uniref:Uncharacterized protein n=1 Tax=Enterobius vermicularis TaxID=51028 RepID=A0A0N4VI24_ENTVE|nr:unnamed protein product [Enterobius vermicularis]